MALNIGQWVCLIDWRWTRQTLHMHHVRWYTETKTTPQVLWKSDPSPQGPLVWALICIKFFPSLGKCIRICLAQFLFQFIVSNIKAFKLYFVDMRSFWRPDPNERFWYCVYCEFMWNRMWGLIFNHRLTQNTTHISCSKGDLWEGRRLCSLFTICLFL